MFSGVCALFAIRVPQIFNDLDVQDDKLMLDLAVFLNRLVSLMLLEALFSAFFGARG